MDKLFPEDFVAEIDRQMGEERRTQEEREEWAKDVFLETHKVLKKWECHHIVAWEGNETFVITRKLGDPPLVRFKIWGEFLRIETRALGEKYYTQSNGNDYLGNVTWILKRAATFDPLNEPKKEEDGSWIWLVLFGLGTIGLGIAVACGRRMPW